MRQMAVALHELQKVLAALNHRGERDRCLAQGFTIRIICRQPVHDVLDQIACRSRLMSRTSALMCS